MYKWSLVIFVLFVCTACSSPRTLEFNGVPSISLPDISSPALTIQPSAELSSAPSDTEVSGPYRKPRVLKVEDGEERYKQILDAREEADLVRFYPEQGVGVTYFLQEDDTVLAHWISPHSDDLYSVTSIWLREDGQTITNEFVSHDNQDRYIPRTADTFLPTYVSDWKFVWYTRENTCWPIQDHTLKWNSDRTVFAWVPDVDNGTTFEQWETFYLGDSVLLPNGVNPSYMWQNFGVIDYRPGDSDWKHRVAYHYWQTQLDAEPAKIWVWNNSGTEVSALSLEIESNPDYSLAIEDNLYGYDLDFTEGLALATE